ncbi:MULTISPECIES: class D sortase [Bacillaceae]|uniref:class D sortase n=1 Tax=Bacillaceae TaxID=186817 RepID=UPI002964D063|nr:class D sortase [Bacillus infantis]MDW2878212.1 class D sortase [Bacillus infantis]
MKAKGTLLLYSAIIFILAGGGLLLFSVKEAAEQSKQTEEALEAAKRTLPIKEAALPSKERPAEKPIIPVFKTGDIIGILEIPALKAELPIIEGTDEEELEKGVGHYAGTVFPGQKDQILLSGHRDTVFRKIGELKMGDELVVKMPYGDFTYEIIESFIVDADDTTVIKPTAPEEILTLSTCYPFYFVGSAPERYILTAKRVEAPHS